MGPEQTDEGDCPPGSGETIEGLFLALEAPLLRYAARWLSDAELAQDVVQEAFLKLQGRCDTVSEPRSWLYRTIHNLALNHLRSNARVVPLKGSGPGTEDADDVTDVQPLPDEQLVRWEGIGLVRSGLANLDERSRWVVHLKFKEDLSYREIAQRTGLTEGHVGYLLHHALKSLAADLAKAGLLP